MIKRFNNLKAVEELPKTEGNELLAGKSSDVQESLEERLDSGRLTREYIERCSVDQSNLFSFMSKSMDGQDNGRSKSRKKRKSRLTVDVKNRKFLETQMIMSKMSPKRKKNKKIGKSRSKFLRKHGNNLKKNENKEFSAFGQISKITKAHKSFIKGKNLNRSMNHSLKMSKHSSVPIVPKQNQKYLVKSFKKISDISKISKTNSLRKMHKSVTVRKKKKAKKENKKRCRTISIQTDQLESKSSKSSPQGQRTRIELKELEKQPRKNQKICVLPRSQNEQSNIQSPPPEGPSSKKKKKKGNHEQEFVNYLLEERSEFLSALSKKEKEIETLKDEMRRMKTLSLYYPDTRDQIIEEGEGISERGFDNESSFEDTPKKKRQVDIIAVSNSVNLDESKNSSEEAPGLRGSLEFASKKKDLLRQSNFIPGLNFPDSSDISPIMANSQNKRELRRSMEDPITSANSAKESLNSSISRSPVMTGATNSPKLETKEVKKLTLNFLNFLKKSGNEELEKYAEYTLLQMETLTKKQDSQIRQLKKRNFSLVSVISDLKEKEKDFRTEISNLKEKLESFKKSHKANKEEWETILPEEKRQKLKRIIDIPKSSTKLTKSFNLNSKKIGSKSKADLTQSVDINFLEKEVPTYVQKIGNTTNLNTGPQTQFFNVSINSLGGCFYQQSQGEKNAKNMVSFF